MSAPQVKGWCPGAYRPMRSGDGLVVRVRPPLGQLSPVQAAGLSEMATRFGSGAIEATARANLQLRGVNERDYPALIDGLEDLDLLPGGAETEARRNLILDPFRENGDLSETMAGALLDGLAAPAFDALPGKFGFVMDLGPRRQLAQVSGDIRIEGTESGMMLRADGAATGCQVPDGASAVQAALALARWFLDSGGVGADGRGRMARHLDAGARVPQHLSGDAMPVAPAPPCQPGAWGRGTCVAAAFGQFTAAGLAHLAEQDVQIRVTPFRMLFLPGIASVPEHSDLILTPGDPLRRVQACTGAPGCSQASVGTRDMARRLAPGIPDGQIWHVAGCAKGCAWPQRADVTLVGRDGAFDLVNSGRPWDEPHRRGLRPADITDNFRP